MATQKINYKKKVSTAKELLKNDHPLAAEVARQWAEKHGYLFLAKEDDAALEKSGGWNLAMKYKTRKGK